MATKEELLNQYLTVRQQTELLCCPLATEDYVIQSVSDVSPPKWHLAHTTWFFETFILAKMLADYECFDSSFQYLFNSYYQGIGSPYPRDKRGLLSRPLVETVYNYRHHVDEHLQALLKKADSADLAELECLLSLGLHHEQQHQELLLMDIKHNFSVDPNFPRYKTKILTEQKASPKLFPVVFIEMEGGLVDIGYPAEGFCYDNELPMHKSFLNPYCLANRLVTNGEYLEFIAAGGYQKPLYWLSEGWDCIQQNQWQAPLYWHRVDEEWFIFSLNGLSPLNPAEPVAHLSYYEADAFARWSEARLPTEEEWEHFVVSKGLTPNQVNFMENGHFHPQALSGDSSAPQQFFGELWEWTSSAYSAYPGYKPIAGKLGEYNGKFMSNQMVLRGGCCATPASHLRASYRNFFQPEKRWQFSGLRLAKDC